MNYKYSFFSLFFLLSACVQTEKPMGDIFAQSDLLPPREETPAAEQKQPAVKPTTPPIVVPEQTTLPKHVLSPEPGSTPYPIVQTIVIPQTTPMQYPTAQQPIQTPVASVSYSPNMVPQQQNIMPTTYQEPQQPVYQQPVQTTQPVYQYQQQVQPVYQQPVEPVTVQIQQQYPVVVEPQVQQPQYQQNVAPYYVPVQQPVQQNSLNSIQSYQNLNNDQVNIPRW